MIIFSISWILSSDDIITLCSFFASLIASQHCIFSVLAYLSASLSDRLNFCIIMIPRQYSINLKSKSYVFYLQQKFKERKSPLDLFLSFILFIFLNNIFSKIITFYLFLINLFQLENDFFTILWWFLPYIDMNQLLVHMGLIILNYPSTSLSTPSPWVVPEHWFWVLCFMHQTCTGHLFHIW